MTPEDLTAIGIQNPAHRKRLKTEISRLNICDGLPEHLPGLLLLLLHLLHLLPFSPPHLLTSSPSSPPPPSHLLRPGSLEEWLRLLRLEDYLPSLREQGYTTVHQVPRSTTSFNTKP